MRRHRAHDLRRAADELERLLNAIREDVAKALGLRLLRPGPPAHVIAGWQETIEHATEVELEMGEITTIVGATLTAHVQFLDADGNPTTTDAPPSWSSNDEAVATCVASEDAQSATVTTVAVGSAVIECLAIETDDAGEESRVRATGVVNVETGDTTPDAVVGEVTFEETA